VAELDLKKLSPLDWTIVGAGAVSLISLFLPWWGANASYLGVSTSSSVSGFSSGYGLLAALMIVAAGVILVVIRSGQSIPFVVVLVLSILGTLLVAIRWLGIPSGSIGVGTVSLSYGPRIGIIITLLVGIAQAVCAIVVFRKSSPESTSTPPTP
jgi:hypothetical protein